METKACKPFSFIFLFFVLLPLQSHAKLEDPKREDDPSPFGFLKHLQGCHKGDKVKGINDLKTYLKEFGYLNYPGSKNNQTHANDDEFDDFLESAIKTYQLNYHLNVTGDLDAPTVSKMMGPRCGVADISNGTNWMRRGKKSSHHASSSFHTVSHFSFFEGRPRWPAFKSRLTYAFATGTHRDTMSPVARAFNKWASVSHFSFSMIQNFANADIKIGFHRNDHGDGSPFDGRGGILAHAWPPTNGRFHYDADEPWSIGAVPGAFDLETVALHEIGHLLGLGHSSVPEAIMYSEIASGRTKGLHEDDIGGIGALYT